MGRKFHGELLMSEQESAVDRLVELAADAEVDLVVIAGDLYDRAIPPSDAVGLFDDALVRLHGTGARIVAIAGNHDSPKRVAVADQILEHAGVTVRGDVSRCVEPLRFDPGDGGPPVAVYPVPFLEPSLAGPAISRLDGSADAEVSRRFGHNEVMNRATALIRRHAASGGPARTVVVAHTFVSGGTTTDSERDLSIGNIDVVDMSAFDGFDYVALGHLHRGQAFDGGRVAYSGTPLAYSFSEERRARLDEAQPAVDADRELLRLAEAAETLRHVLDREQRSREQLKKYAIDVSERFAAVQKSWADAPDLPDNVDLPPVDDAAPLSALASIRTALARHRDKLEGFVADASSAKARQSDAAAERATEASERRLNKEQRGLAAGHMNDREATETALLEARSAAERIPTLRTTAEQAKVRADAVAELDSLGPKLDTAKQALMLAERATLDRRRVALDLRQRYIEGIAAVLAGQLEEAVPCPVCGSTDHPDPATPAGDAVQIDDIESAEADADEAMATEEVEREAHQKINSRVDELRGRAGVELTDSINAWIDNWNHSPRPFVWHKSADDIFETMALYLQRIPQTGH